jgi:hypothetical protein
MNPFDLHNVPIIKADDIISDEPRPAPVTDRELLERVAALLEKHEDDLETIRWRTGCLFAWLVASVLLGLFSAVRGCMSG